MKIFICEDVDKEELYCKEGERYNQCCQTCDRVRKCKSHCDYAHSFDCIAKKKIEI